MREGRSRMSIHMHTSACGRPASCTFICTGMHVDRHPAPPFTHSSWSSALDGGGDGRLRRMRAALLVTVGDIVAPA
jgi:hypothetical protein